MGGACRTHGEINTYKNMIGKLEGRRLLRRSKRRLGAYITTHLMEIGGKVWTGCIWFMIRTSGGWALVNTVMNRGVP